MMDVKKTFVTYDVLSSLELQTIRWFSPRRSDRNAQQTASPMLTAIMSGGVVISGRELYKYR